MSLRVTPVARPGPLLRTVNVYVRLTPTVAGLGAAVAVIDRSAAAAGNPTDPENSEVLPFGSVAVALTNWPGASAANEVVKLALPAASVATFANWPRYVCPWPKPEGSAASLR